MRLFLAIITLLFTSLAANAQPCGANVSQEDAQFMKPFSKLMRSYGVGEQKGIRDFPIQMHIVTKNNGNGGCDVKVIKEAIQNLNNYYINANVRFVLLDDVHYIKSTEYFDFDTKEEDGLCAANDVKGVINMYFCGTVQMQGTELCGYAYFPNSQSYLMRKDRVIMQNTCVDDNCTLPHEIGHYFSLYHTHGKTNFGSTDELVNQSNCGVAGDEMCDTPADPMIFGKVDNDCHYTGGDKDRNGQAFRPNTTNMMSYSNNSCLQEFSAQQYARINYAAFQLRTYLQFPNKVQSVPANATTSAPVATNNAPRISKLSGELDLKIERQAVPVELDGNLYRGKLAYSSGTSYQVAVKNGEPAFVYVVGADLKYDPQPLFPQSGQSPFFKLKDQKVLLPSENERYTMDNTKGKDFLCVLYSRQELNIQAITANMKTAKGTFMQRLYSSLGDKIVPANQISYTQGGKMAFSASTIGNQAIVPIVIVLKHE